MMPIIIIVVAVLFIIIAIVVIVVFLKKMKKGADKATGERMQHYKIDESDISISNPPPTVAIRQSELVATPEK